MRLLLEEEKVILEDLTKKLREQADLTLKFKNYPGFDVKEQELQTKLGKHQAYIKDRKHNLFLRDSQDFKEGRVYSTFVISFRRGREGKTDKQVYPKQKKQYLVRTSEEDMQIHVHVASNNNGTKEEHHLQVQFLPFLDLHLPPLPLF